MAHMTTPTTPAQRVAYAAVSARFNLAGAQRTALDNSYLYTQVMDAGIAADWPLVGQLLMDAGITGLIQVLNAADRQYAPAASGCIRGI